MLFTKSASIRSTHYQIYSGIRALLTYQVTTDYANGATERLAVVKTACKLVNALKISAARA
jgi:hypothetical protein